MGLMILEVFSGQPVFVDEQHANDVFHKLVEGDIEPLLQLVMQFIPHDLRDSVRSLLALNPSDRMDMATLRRVRFRALPCGLAL